MEMGWRWDFAYEILPQMLIATLNTIVAAGVGYAIALVVGLFFLLGQRTPSKIINAITYPTPAATIVLKVATNICGKIS